MNPIIHPHLNGLKVMDIGLFVLVYGQPIVGEIKLINDEYIILQQPYSMHAIPQSGGRIAMNIAPFGAEFFFEGSNQARAIAVSHIIQGEKCPEKIATQYKAARSGLVVR